MTRPSDERTTSTSPEGGRAVPYFCPFCAEEDLRPLAAGDVPDLARPGWHCRSCLRVFSLGFYGLHQPVSVTPSSVSLESERS